jgi:hypothetical protein
MRSATGRRLQGCTQCMRRASWRCCWVARDREWVYGLFSLSTDAVCWLCSSLLLLCKSAGGITTCTSSPFSTTHTHTHYLYHHHPYPCLPHRPRACSCSSHPHERSPHCGLQQKSNLLPPPPGPPPTAPCDALLCSIEPCVTSPRRHARACTTIQITAVR